VVQPLALQVLNNVLGLVTGWLAVCKFIPTIFKRLQIVLLSADDACPVLYFNIGMKVVYLEVGVEMFKLPAITEKKGKYLWWGLGPLYWIVAFVFAMSIPQFTAFTNFVGGLFSLNFTYSFSSLMYLVYKIQDGARLPGEGFDPATGVTTRHDTGTKRWIRGFFKAWYITVPVLVFTLGGLAASGMGTWAAVLALEEAFASSSFSSWGCCNPYYNPLCHGA